MKKILIAVVAVIILVPLVVFFGFPGVLVNLSTNKARKAASLVPGTLRSGTDTIAYLEGGSGEAVVLVHGLGGNKDNWPAFARSLTKSYRVIALDFNQKIFFDVFGEEYSFKKDLPIIRARTLVIWGDTDRKVDVSLVNVLKAGIKDASSVIIEKCGHFPMREKPGETATKYLEFLKKA